MGKNQGRKQHETIIIFLFGKNNNKYLKNTLKVKLYTRFLIVVIFK